jgi:hypothetical protein
VHFQVTAPAENSGTSITTAGGFLLISILGRSLPNMTVPERDAYRRGQYGHGKVSGPSEHCSAAKRYANNNHRNTGSVQCALENGSSERNVLFIGISIP